MKEQNWNSIESQCEAITASLDVIDESIADIRSVSDGKRINVLLTTISNEVDNVRLSSDRIYSDCEDDYADTNDEYFRADDWEQLIDAIPDPAQMSAGEMDSLLETIREWRKANGYPVPYSCY
jgi:hypothetical protein